MDAVLSRLKGLTPDELRKEILAMGMNCGPVTATTRSIFERKLARAIQESQGGEGESSDTSESVPGNCQSAPTVIITTATPTDPACSSTQPPAPNDEGDFGYGVGLNPPEEEALLHQGGCPDSLGGDSSQAAAQTPSTGPPASPPLYYGVCPVWDDILSRNDRVHVYADKKEALQAVKLMKGSRFKAFPNREDAEKFAKGICDYYPSPSKSSFCVSPVKVGMVFSKDGMASLEAETMNQEKANSFKSPRTQDLTAKLRKAVEKGDETTFNELVWSNPRYLIGSGDNPTVVQEGCRYNVMHVAAKENQPAICQLLLDTLENPDFMRLMYPDDSEVMLHKRICYIVDLYLNTPDKVLFETPLHFACKFGNPEVVNVLCSHPGIEKHGMNKYDQVPADVICERSKNKSRELIQKIRDYLEDRWYIPLLRATDNSSPAVIGDPWSPDPSDTTSHSFLSRLACSPKDPVMTVRAFAGPLGPSKADEFRRVWKTPPRDRAGHYHHVRKSDAERGAERVGRDLAHEMGHPWAEYWEFIGCFIDLASAEGLRKLEEHLSKKDLSERIQQEAGENETSNRFKSPSPSGKSKKICNSISVGAFLEDDDDMSLEEIKNRQNAALTNITAVCGKDGSIGAAGGLECHILPITHSTDLIETAAEQSRHRPEKATVPLNKNGFYSPVSNEKTPNADRQSQSSADGLLSPVSNLMIEFEKLSLESKESEQGQSGKKSRGRHEDDEDPCTSLTTEIGHLGFLENEGNVFGKARDTCESEMEVEVEAEDKSSTSSEEWFSTEETLEGINKRTASTAASELGGCARPQSWDQGGKDLSSSSSSSSSYKSLDNLQDEFILRTPPKLKNKGLFIAGDEPTKLDSDVLVAVGGVEIDPQKYPTIHKWKHTVLSYSSSDMQSWPSPAVLKGRPGPQMFSSGSPGGSSMFSSPNRYSPGKHSSSSPGFGADLGSPGRYSPAHASHVQLLRLKHFSEPSN